MTPTTVHPKVVWSAVATFAFSFLTYELQKHNVWQPDAAEASFIATAVTFVVGYVKRADGEVPADTPLAVPAIAVPAVAVPAKPAVDPALVIPPKPITPSTPPAPPSSPQP